MMKKLLVLLLVFGITSVAHAGYVDILIVSLNGEFIDPVKEITISESDWVDIDIIYSTATEGQRMTQCFVELLLTGMGTLDVSDLTFPEGVYDFDATYSPGTTEVVAGKQYLLQYSEGIAGTGVVYPGGIAIDHILVHCDDFPDEVVVTMTDAPVAGAGTMEMDPFGLVGMGITLGPAITITQIPEPMTIALLGLGGLFLLRRRRS
jgi:hypothetical protein